VAKNNVSVPDDFTVPELSPEQIEQMKQKPPGIPNMPGPTVDDGAPAPGKDKGNKPAAPPKKGK
jgi:hypothetical protein